MFDLTCQTFMSSSLCSIYLHRSLYDYFFHPQIPCENALLSSNSFNFLERFDLCVEPSCVLLILLFICIVLVIFCNPQISSRWVLFTRSSYVHHFFLRNHYVTCMHHTRLFCLWTFSTLRQFHCKALVDYIFISCLSSTKSSTIM